MADAFLVNFLFIENRLILKSMIFGFLGMPLDQYNFNSSPRKSLLRQLIDQGRIKDLKNAVAGDFASPTPLIGST